MADGFRIAKAYVEVAPDTEGFRDKLQADLDAAVAGVRADVGVGLNDKDLSAKIDEIRAKLDDLDGRDVRPSVGLETADFDGKDDDVNMRLDRLDGRHADPTVGLNLDDFDLKIAEANAELDALEARTTRVNVGGSGSGGGGDAGSAAAGAGGGGEGGGIIAAIGLGLGAMLPGVAPALTSMGLAGATGFGALGGIFSALSAHAQGVQQQSMNSFQNAAMLQSSQMQLAETVRNAAASQIQAIQGVTMAEQQLQQAQFQEQDAQVNLTNARIQARLTLQSLNNAEKDSVLGVKAAQLALAQAEYQQKLTDQNAMTTALDRQQAALQVAEAQQQLTEAQQNQNNATAAASRANKLGVNGSQQVVLAEQAVIASVNGVKDARMQMADAQRNVTLTELNNATQIKQAQLAVASAQRQSTASFNQFRYEMAKLTKPAQDVVNMLLGMHGAVRGLEHIAQQTVLPGVVIFLNGVKSILPELRTGMRLMGTAMGNSFGQFGKLMQTPAFKDGLAGLLRNSVQFANIVLPAFAQFLQMLGQVGGKAGAGTGLANFIAGFAQGLTGLVATLGHYIAPINQLFTAMGTILRALGPSLGQIIGLIAQALAPLAKYLNTHPNGALVKAIADVLAGLLAWKVASKLILGPMKGLWETLSGGFGKLKEVWAKAGQAYISWFGEGGKVSRAGAWIKGLGSKIASGFSAAWGGISSFGSKLGGMLVTAGQSVAGFVSGMAKQLGQAMAATGVWIAEHAAATAAFIAENVAQAASATAAFIAENAATLGIVAGIAALVAAIIWLATHWHQVWGAIKTVALDVWHNVLDPMWQGIKKGAEWLYNVAIKPNFEAIKLQFRLLEDAALWLWHNVFDPVWQGIMAGVRGFVSGFQTVWNTIQTIFKNPVNFLIGTVYDKGIARFWNDIVTHIGLSSLKLPQIATLATGGIVPGRDTGRDNQLVAMRSGEGVLVPEAVQAIGPGTVHALNNMYGSGGSRSGDGKGGFSNGGILGDIGGFFSGVGHDIMSGAKFMAQFAINPIGAVTSLLDKAISTPAAGDLAKIMTGIPTTLVKDLAGFISSFGSSGPGGKGGGLSTPGAVSGSVASWFTQALKLTGAPLSWLADLETIARYESGDNPNAINLTDSNAKAGDPSRGIMQTIMSTFLAYHQAGTSMNIYNPIANIAAAIRYIRGRYGTPGNTPGIISLAHGGGYQGYDSGGWLMPGGMPINQTGRPEAVLTPEESAAFVELVKRFTGGGPDGGAGLAGGVNFNYFGTQYPTVEQRMLQRRDLALALGGAGG